MRLFTILALILCCMQIDAQEALSKYDKKLADSLGADEYGMKSYVLVILKTGTNKESDKKKLDSLFAGHMSNIGRLVAANKLVVAGPMEKNDRNYRGIFILDVKTIDEARALLQTDPAVQSKLLDAELYGWYGSAALPLYLEGHGRIEKVSH